MQVPNSQLIKTSSEWLTLFQLYRDGKRVLECLQRALRVADACMDTAVSVELFVEILNRYVYYFDQQNETVSPIYLHSMTSPANILTPSLIGHNKIPQRPHRAHPLESTNKPRELELRSSQKAFPAHAGLYLKQGVRGCCHASKIMMGLERVQLILVPDVEEMHMAIM